MHKRLYNFLLEHNILYQNQFGFRKNNSTVYALAQITEMIKVSIDSRKLGCGIFVDMRKESLIMNLNTLNELEKTVNKEAYHQTLTKPTL